MQRSDFCHVIDNQLQESHEHKQLMALLLVKLCRLKDINAAYGFNTGDCLLVAVEQKLKSILRPKDIIARLGDNEFGLLLPDLHNSTHAILAVNKILTEFEHPLECNENIIEPKIVIGVALVSNAETGSEALIQQAALAVTQAEHATERFVVYGGDLEDDLPPTMIVEQELHRAFENEEFKLLYQPKIDLKQRRLIGAEALIRWKSSKYGHVDTEEFIRVIEDSSLLIPLTKWILTMSLRHCLDMLKTTPNYVISVNISPMLLNDVAIVDLVVGALNIWGVEPRHLMLEVTEGAMIKNPRLSAQILQQLSDHGLGISIDDFGTGYSSLSYLKDLPVNELKIDKSFVLSMLENPKDENIVQATTELAHALGLKVIAEGIESDEVYQRIADFDCDYGQGFFMGRPMEQAAFVEWVQQSGWAV